MKTPKHELVDEKKTRQSRTSPDKEARRLKKLLERETREEIAKSRKFDLEHEQHQRTFGHSILTHTEKSYSGDSAQLLDFPARRGDPFSGREAKLYQDLEHDTARHFGGHGNHNNCNCISCCPPKPDCCQPSSCSSDYSIPRSCPREPSPKQCRPPKSKPSCYPPPKPDCCPPKPKTSCCAPKQDCCPQKSHCDCDKLEYTWPARWLTSGLCDAPDPPVDPPVDPPTEPVPPCQSYTCNGALQFEGLKPDIDNGGSSTIWERELVTPQPLKCSCKNLLRLDVTTNDCDFSFNVKISNQVNTGCTEPDPDSFNINPKSCDTPLTLGNYVRIHDPARDPIYDSFISYYTADEGNLNQFTYAVDTFRTGQNLLLFNQLFFIHVGQNRHNAKLTITAEPELGENQFRVKINTPCQVEIKENITCVKVDPEQFEGEEFPDVGGVSIKQHIVYVGGTYFFTYAYYVGNQRTAREWTNYTFQAEQGPFQLLAMVLFCPLLPVPDIFRAFASTSQQKHLKQMYIDISPPDTGVIPDGEPSCYYPCRNYLPDCNTCQPCCGQTNSDIGPTRLAGGRRASGAVATGRTVNTSKEEKAPVAKSVAKKPIGTQNRATTSRLKRVTPSKRAIRKKLTTEELKKRLAEKKAQKLALEAKPTEQPVVETPVPEITVVPETQAAPEPAPVEDKPIA